MSRYRHRYFLFVCLLSLSLETSRPDFVSVITNLFRLLKGLSSAILSQPHASEYGTIKMHNHLSKVEDSKSHWCHNSLWVSPSSREYCGLPLAIALCALTYGEGAHRSRGSCRTRYEPAVLMNVLQSPDSMKAIP